MLAKTIDAGGIVFVGFWTVFFVSLAVALGLRSRKTGPPPSLLRWLYPLAVGGSSLTFVYAFPPAWVVGILMLLVGCAVWWWGVRPAANMPHDRG